MIKSKAAFVAILAVTASAAFAATPGIGVALSQGDILVNNARTAGNATLFEGSMLQTMGTPTQIRLTDGGYLRMPKESRAKVFRDRVEIMQGSATVSGMSSTANGLRIMPEQNASASIGMNGKTVLVAAVTGNVHVFNSAGLNVANLLPGRALNLTPQDAGASAPSQLVGCVQKAGDVLTLIDETTNVTVQLRGNSSLRAGRRYQITGTMVPNATAAGGASQVVNVGQAKDVGGSCRATAGTAGAAGAAAGGAAGAAGGAAGAAGGVAGAAAGGAAGAAGAAAGAAGAAAGAAAAGVTAAAAATVGVTAAVVGGVAAAASSGNNGNTTQGGTAGVDASGGCLSPCSSQGPF